MRTNRPATIAVAAVVALAAALLPAGAAGETLAKGKLLVARRGMLDPNFAETVVLLVDYDEEGAMGLVVNLPTQLRVAVALPELDSLDQRQETVFIGGPVAVSQMLLLVESERMPEESMHVFADVYLSSSPKLLDRLAREGDSAPAFRVFAGHAGWAPGQLDAEVDRGDWFVVPGEAETIFYDAPGELWRELIRKSDVQWARAGGARPPRIASR